MAKDPHSIAELKSFRIMKLYNSPNDKGIAFVKVKSLDEELCKNLQKVRSKYFIATAECYYNSDADIANIVKYDRYFDFHIVSCDRIGKVITRSCPRSKYFIMGAGEFMTNPDLFKMNNVGNRKIDFIASANSFWGIKNFHKILEMQKYLMDHGVKTQSRIICGSIKDRDHYDFCDKFIEKHLPSNARIIIGLPIDQIVEYYNKSKFLVHFSSMDSSPRVVFESLLCGCHCLLAGAWTESLNKWLDSPLIHVIKEDDYSEVKEILLNSKPDRKLVKKYNRNIGLMNLSPSFISFVREHLQPTMTENGVMGQSVVGKITFKDRDAEYEIEINKLRRLL